jgi:hypothetical protein
MRQSSNITVTRGNLGLLASSIGFSGIIAGVVAFIWRGSFTVYAGVSLAIGVIGLILWAITTPQEFRAFFTGRSIRFGTITILATVLLIGIVALVYLLLSNAAITWDMTTNFRFSLSSTSQDILRRVTVPIQITGFYTSEALSLREIDDQFFRLYEVETNGMIRRRYYDPEESPAIANAFGVNQDGMVFVSYLNPDGEVEINSAQYVPRGPNQERDMTETISRLLIAGTLTVYFDTALGERDPLDASAEGISGINNGVQENGLITQPLNIRDLAQNGGDIPANASTVVFARPIFDLNPDEIAVLDRYLQNGGALFLAADVLFNENPFLQASGAFNQYLWDNYGIRALDAVVVDPAVSGQTALDVISAVTFGATDIGARLDPASSPTLFRLARAVDVNLESAPQGVANGRVIMSSDQSYGETNFTALSQTNTYQYDQGEDLPGPLTTVVWAWDQTTNAKILLIGDGDFISNGQVLSTLGNGILFTDGMSWLTGLGERINFPPQAYSTGLPLIFVNNQIFQFIAFIVVVLIPGAVLVSGLAIWARRSRR